MNVLIVSAVKICHHCNIFLTELKLIIASVLHHYSNHNIFTANATGHLCHGPQHSITLVKLLDSGGHKQSQTKSTSLTQSLKAKTLNDKFTPTLKCSHYLHDFKLMESQVKFHSPHNLSGASQQNSVVTFSKTTERDRDLIK